MFFDLNFDVAMWFNVVIISGWLGYVHVSNLKQAHKTKWQEIVILL
jgi:hypothetical protein